MGVWGRASCAEREVLRPSSGMAGGGSWSEDCRLLRSLEGLQSVKASEERRGGVAGGRIPGCVSGEPWI